MELASRADGDGEGRTGDSVYAFNSLEIYKSRKGGTLPFFEKSVGWKGRLNLWVAGSYFLIRGPGEEMELYDVASDPRQRDDLTLRRADSPPPPPQHHWVWPPSGISR